MAELNRDQFEYFNTSTGVILRHTLSGHLVFIAAERAIESGSAITMEQLAKPDAPEIIELRNELDSAGAQLNAASADLVRTNELVSALQAQNDLQARRIAELEDALRAVS